MQDEKLQSIISLLEELRDLSKKNQDRYLEQVQIARKIRIILFPILAFVVITWLYFVVIYFVG